MAPLILILLFVVAWVILIVPKQRELKRHNALVAGLSVGDDVMIGSGIYGTIVSIDGDLVEMQIAPGVEIRIARRAIASLVITPDAEIVDELSGELEPGDETDSLNGGADR
ncbi:YajC Preprotein translocase subunit YajC [Acidimicrobiia bacterium]